MNPGKSSETAVCLPRPVTNFRDISNVSSSQTALTPLINRQKQGQQQTERLLLSTVALRLKTTDEIREHIAHFVQAERAILTDHVLHTRRALANILEHMAKNDNKIESQITPDFVPAVAPALAPTLVPVIQQKDKVQAKGQEASKDRSE